ncbi:MAG TPA: putative glycoside hydrolase [Blastocatellia bacterium]|nr:putative glycoside hydrolase [Blastocatellia bacterium]
MRYAIKSFSLSLMLLNVALGGCISSPVVGGNNRESGDSSVFPNPARLYTKWNSWKDSVEWSQEDKENAVRYTEVIFAVPLGEIEHMRQLKHALNPNVKLLRYINIWPRGAEKLADYTDRMLIHRDWPNQNGVILRFRSLEDECGRDIVDVSRRETREEMARVIEILLDPQGEYRYDGIFFDLSAWEALWYEVSALDVTLPGDPECKPIRRSDKNAPFVTNDYYHKSADFLVAYHKFLRERAIGEKMHIFNGMPNEPDDWAFAPPGFQNSDFYLSQYLDTARVDGGQMDTTFVHGQGKATEERWLFQLEMMRRFITHDPPKYFLAKVHSEDDDKLEYGFASYLLGTDGRHALFGAMGRADWDTNPIMRAPLGNFVGDYQPIAGLSYVFQRQFENGIVIVNAHSSLEQMVVLPIGRYQDVRRGTIHQSAISIPAQSGRILIKIQ